MAAQISIPSDLLPADGRFGSGPTRVRQSALNGLAAMGPSYMGTSHRRDTVRGVVAQLQAGLTDMFGLPEDYEVVLGNGGATAFWDAACLGLIDRRSQHLTFGEFSAKFARAVQGAPHLQEPVVIESDFGTHPLPEPDEGIDFYALTHNETSTGVVMPVRRVDATGLTAVDATSAAGGVMVDPTQFDVYYFSPQKALASDGGLYLALCSPAALQRVEQLVAGSRWIPPFLSLHKAVENSRLNQTYNTPALATLFLLLDTVQWINQQGGLSWSAQHCARNAQILYSWAESHPVAYPFVENPLMRSPVTATIDFDSAVSAASLATQLRSQGVLDVEPYRLLGRNQIRVGLWPAIPPSDVEALTACLDYLIERMAD